MEKKSVKKTFLVNFYIKSRRNGEKIRNNTLFCRNFSRIFFKKITLNHEKMEKKCNNAKLARRIGEKNKNHEEMEKKMK